MVRKTIDRANSAISKNLFGKKVCLSDYTNGLKKRRDGIWYASKSEEVSYPAEGNEQCFGIEDKSFWFRHRNACVIQLVKKFPPREGGPIFDVGGGNGFVAKGLMNAELDVVLVEPGQTGARNAKKRGLQHVVCASTLSAEFKPGSMPAIGVFDVVEHIMDDLGFLRHLHNLLEPGGMLYMTVPAYNFLWSDADDYAGHFRRYSYKRIEELCSAAELDICFLTGVFSWLVAPLFLFRALPFRLVGKRKKNIADVEATMNDHTLPAWVERFVKNRNEWERRRISCRIPIPFGSSLLLAAQK